MFSHSLNGLTYSDTSSSSTSSSPNSFPQSPHGANPFARPPSQLAMHHAPEVPSTFLPSYYPEGRYASLDNELSGAAPSAGPSNALFDDGSMRSHSPATWEKLSQAGPSTRHLLDGINITDPHPRTSRDLAPPSYRITPGSIASSLVPINRISGASSAFPMDTSLQSVTSTPHSLGTDSSGGGGAGGRYHPYSRDRDTYGSVSMSSTPSSLSRNNTYSNTTMPEPTPSSAAYPGNMYGNVPIAERPEVGSWDRSEGELSSEDYARVLDIYNHLMESVPSMRLQHEHIPPGGQRLDNILDLASEGLSVLTGRSGGAHLVPPDAPPAASGQKRSGANGEKKVTKCLGCGATETPEWRRGPMGPRTLCNACGLVHMKLQRKKKKQEEKAAAAAAAAGADKR